MTLNRIIPYIFFSFCCTLITIPFAAFSVIIPGIDHYWYEQPGHINIGVLVDLHEFSRDGYCGQQLQGTSVIRTEAMLYALDQINKDTSILPNLTFGVVICDSCMKDMTSLACVIRLTTERHNYEKNNSHNPWYAWSTKGHGIHEEEQSLQVEIVGVYGAGYSRQAVMVAGYLSLFQVPLLSPFASSDDLSDSSRFPYFSRLIPPDMYQTQAIVGILDYFNWTYVSLVYSEGAYGENAARLIQKETQKKGICLSVVIRLFSEAKMREYHDVLESLTKTHAPVIMLMLEIFHVNHLFHAVRTRGLQGKFVWLGSDSFSSLVSIGNHPDPILEAASGSLYVGPQLKSVPSFEHYFSDVTPWTVPDHPWLVDVWEQRFNCSVYPAKGKKKKCQEDMRYAKLSPWLYSKDIDGMWVYATAIHSLIDNECPTAFRDGALPTNCVTGPLLFEYIKNVSFHGYTESAITFDDSGDILGSFTIYQLLYVNSTKIRVKVGLWSRLDNQIVFDKAIVWPNIKIRNGSVSMVPTAQCSDPCGPREYPVYAEVSCCWTCNPCRRNEILNSTNCVECDELTWPDDKTGTKCVRIPPEYLALKDKDWIAITLAILSCIGVFVTVFVIVAYIVHHEHKLIKATGRELSMVILIGLVLANLSVLLYITPPTDMICIVRPCAFHLAMHLKYAPLVLKTVRIYRIFRNGKTGKAKVSFISSSAQIALMSALIFIQVTHAIPFVVGCLTLQSYTCIILASRSEMRRSRSCKMFTHVFYSIVHYWLLITV